MPHDLSILSNKHKCRYTSPKLRITNFGNSNVVQRSLLKPLVETISQKRENTGDYDAYLFFYSFFSLWYLLLLLGDTWGCIKVDHKLLLPLKLRCNYEYKQQKNKQHWSWHCCYWFLRNLSRNNKELPANKNPFGWWQNLGEKVISLIFGCFGESCKLIRMNIAGILSTKVKFILS